MKTGNVNNVIFLRDTESNVIKEAFIILKDNIKINNIYDGIDNENNIKKINILKEAELLVNQKINQANIEYEKFKIKKLENKLKFLKILNIILVISTIILCIIK